MERRALKRAGLVALAILLGIAVLATRGRMRSIATGPRATPPDVSASAQARVRVQVLNATTVRGLARRATAHLRDQGFDVLEVGTWNEQLDSTIVLDRSGHPAWAKRVAQALGGARVEARPDSSRYLDVTVLVGRSWRPPTEPFYP